MSKHTPGPWHVDQSSSGKSFLLAGRVRLAEVLVDDDDAESFHDAALMAAAPDLLEACEKALMEMNALAEHHVIDCLSLPYLRAALAKANAATPESAVEA